MAYSKISTIVDKELQFLLFCVSSRNQDFEFLINEKFIIDEIRWDEIIKKTEFNCLFPSLYKYLNTKIPVSYLNIFQQYYYRTLSRNTILYNGFCELTNLLHESKIEFIALKGIFLSEWLYGDIGLRQMSDIDILVKNEDGRKCIKILENNGFVPLDTGETEFAKFHQEIVHFPAMVKDGISIEVHIKLHKEIERYHLDNEILWKNTAKVIINGIEVLALGKYDQLIHLCVHLDKHLQSGHVQFTCFMDIVNYLEKFKDDFDWRAFVDRCTLFNCVNETFSYLLLCNKYMYAFLPKYIISEYHTTLNNELEKKFIRYLEKGNDANQTFGHSVKSHLHNSNNISSSKEKIKYLRDIVLPPKEFILKKYQPYIRLSGGGLRNIKFWRIWYVHRWYIGLKGLIRLIMKSIEHRTKSKE